MSSLTYIIFTILEIGLYFGPIFILVGAWRSFDKKAMAIGLVLTAAGWVAMDINRSAQCDDWELLGYSDEDGCKSMYFEGKLQD